MAYFDVKVGLHQPSSATTVAREMTNGQTAVKGLAFCSVAGKYTLCTSINAQFAEWLLETPDGNMSSKAVGIFGSFEAETDQVDISTSNPLGGSSGGTIIVDDLLGLYNGKLVKYGPSPTAGAIVVGRCISIAGTIYRFRTV